MKLSTQVNCNILTSKLRRKLVECLGSNTTWYCNVIRMAPTGRFVLIALAITFSTNNASSQSQTFPLDSSDFKLFESSDLKKYLDTAIIGKQVVALGESRHLMGIQYYMKAELCKILMKYYGFNVLAIESPQFDMDFAKTKNLKKVCALHGVWWSKEIGELLDSAESEFNAQVYGVDILVNWYGKRYLTDSLFTFLDRVHPEFSNDKKEKTHRISCEGFWEFERKGKFR